ncbi:MAG: SDR family oxidoreductase [Deltaproteobacteria bacterium]|nr:SDR family oxidoreductase [Deltaproteobacteria bacterium]
MRVFLTGASGFVGSAVLSELLRAGHRVLALARSEAAAARVADLGAEVLRGDLTDLDALARGAHACDGAVHCAFSHDDFTDRANNCRKDREAIDALGGALAGTDHPLVITMGLGAGTEDDATTPEAGAGRGASELLALAYAARGVRVSAVRLPPSVHGDGDHGFVPMLIANARQTGRAGYIGDGANRWPAVHRSDAARLFRIALERAPAGARLHAVGDEGVATRAIAQAIGARLGLPVESVPREHFGWLGMFYGADLPASSALTQQRFDWRPVGPGLLEDLARGRYFDTV